MKNLSPLDPSSYSRPEQAVITHIHFNLTVDFVTKTLNGHADLSFIIKDNLAKELVLDVKDLDIKKVTLLDSDTSLNFTITDTIKDMGSKFTIAIPEVEGNSIKIRIDYSTSANASGLQWLEPVHTVGKIHPYLFSQLEAIHARSVYPCQDTPGVKFTYSANIQSDEVFTVLMSAERGDIETSNGRKVSRFSQKIPIPAYLVAFAVGVLESRKIGPRSHVWCEKEVIDAAAFEFAETEKQLRTAEELCGPYVWGIYDLLVLPPSFPLGGMENPCLTFVTPTLLAGDRSLANVVAHEIAHSWTGNLVTNINFEHFWLNEGFTVFTERKIKGRLSSPKDQDFDAFVAVSNLQETIKNLGESNPLTSLVISLTGVNPDDAFSLVPYEKGHMLLRYIEEIVGGPETFEPFLRSYFETFKYKSISTNDFVQFFKDHFKDNPDIHKIEWEKWLYAPGMPPVIPKYDTSLATAADQIRQKLLEGNETQASFSEIQKDFKNLTSEQKIYLLISIFESGPLSKEKCMSFSKLGLDDIKNSEIKFLWLRICIAARHEDKVEKVFEWINEIGRMKFVRPLYRDLYAWEEIRPRAIENFQVNRKNMMRVLEYGVLKELHLIQ